MSWSKRQIAWVFCALTLVLAGCGGSSSSSNTVPVPTDPNGGGSSPIDPNNNPVDPRLPSTYYRKVAVDFLNNTTTLDAILKPRFVFVAPLVGDFHITFQLPSTRSASFDNARVWFFVEDYEGLKYTSVPQYQGTGTSTSTSLDAIFANDTIVVSTHFTLNGNDLTGDTHYRLRASGDTACRVQVWQNCGPEFGTVCPPPVYDVPGCQSYMNTGNAAVKFLGSFVGTYSNWGTL